VRRRILNLRDISLKILDSQFSPPKIHFDFVNPFLDPLGRGGDSDAVCMINFVDIKYCLQRFGIKILTISPIALAEYKSLMQKLGELPIIRSYLGPSVFLIGIKEIKGN